MLADLVADLLFGPLWFWLLLMQAPPTPAYAKQVLDREPVPGREHHEDHELGHQQGRGPGERRTVLRLHRNATEDPGEKGQPRATGEPIPG